MNERYKHTLYCVVCGSDDVFELNWVKVHDASVITENDIQFGVINQWGPPYLSEPWCKRCKELTSIGDWEAHKEWLEEGRYE